MTLVVSVRVPDGVVVGADSLATLKVSGQGRAKTTATCPNCGHEHDIEAVFDLPPGMGTLSTLPYSLKLVPMFGQVAVATSGSGMIGGRTVFSLLVEFQEDYEFKDLQALADDLGGWLLKRLADSMDVTQIGKDQRALGFQASGYDKGEPKTHIVSIGREVKREDLEGFGVTVSGETAVIKQLWQLRELHPQMGSAYQTWSVLDAAEYIRFAINTTASFQRFLTMVPTVGGDVDVALVTRDGNFRWIDKKPLVDLLLPRTGGAKGDE